MRALGQDAGRIRRMPSPESLRRLATLTKKVRDDLRNGGMGVNFRYLFRSTAILARVVEILADHVATEAEHRKAQAEAPDATAEVSPQEASPQEVDSPQELDGTAVDVPAEPRRRTAAGRSAGSVGDDS